MVASFRDLSTVHRSKQDARNAAAEAVFAAVLEVVVA